ncbi:uncharacterized protein Tco025E_00118 [Trypanosoma conorhini]|uniref:Uncharacterized protein n=1 Tax=Trypanosoma conorhini TaxID=83891 RepID=A0A3R7PMR2_9TRYP|nr:uncharacterized protein Tco025E_00118 [Trypanosoma conorhini]RNF27734.1 hypothetical protein Tco025E_00118 [Trypanosoma conorhini]
MAPRSSNDVLNGGLLRLDAAQQLFEGIAFLLALQQTTPEGLQLLALLPDVVVQLPLHQLLRAFPHKFHQLMPHRSVYLQRWLLLLLQRHRRCTGNGKQQLQHLRLCGEQYGRVGIRPVPHFSSVGARLNTCPLQIFLCPRP